MKNILKDKYKEGEGGRVGGRVGNNMEYLTLYYDTKE
jgi:hypothetical protein